MSSVNETFEIQVTSPNLLDEKLEAAVRNLQNSAVRTGTRHPRDPVEPGRYTAALSGQVPFGMTRELMH